MIVVGEVHLKSDFPVAPLLTSPHIRIARINKSAERVNRLQRRHLRVVEALPFRML